MRVGIDVSPLAQTRAGTARYMRLLLPEEKIRVVHNGVDERFRPEGPAADGQYVLAVGTLEPRKNLPAAQEAARRLGIELRIVGERGWGGVAAPGWVGRVTDDRL